MKNVDEAMKLYYNVAKAWLLKSIKKPLIALLQYPNESFDFND